MASRQLSLFRNFINAVIWLAGASLFAILPFLFLQLIGWLSEEEVTRRELVAIADVRYIVFVCCALTGAVFMSFVSSPVKVTSVLGIFAIYLSPFIMALYLLLNYLLLYIQYNNVHEYGPGESALVLVEIFTVVYCLGGRTLLGMKMSYRSNHSDV
jgi:hypothetical protein